MDDGLQILIYIGAVVFWIVSTILKNKKNAQRPKPPVFVPQPTETADTFDELEVKIDTEQEKTTVWNSQKETFLDRNPYRESIEYKKRKAKQKQILAAKEEKQEVEQEDIDWKKAVIYSEILRPRF